MQRQVWRVLLSNPIQDYQLKTGTYGTAPASFMVVKCLRKFRVQVVYVRQKNTSKTVLV